MFHLRLRSSIVLVVVIGLLIPVSVSSYFTLGQRERDLRLRMQTDHARVTEILALGMQEPLWNIDAGGGVPLFESLLGDKRIVAIEVRDNRGREFLARTHPERRQGSQSKLARPIVHRGETIGDASVEIDSGQLDAELAHDRLVFAATVAGQLLLSLVLIVTLLQRRMLVPIGRLIRESGRLAERDLATPFVWKQADELGSLGASLEHTRQALLSLFDEIEAKNRMLERDIELRAQTQQELQRHRDHLEELVAERTDELQQAKRRADIANQAKSAFLSSMTHELRTPLNAILGYAQILRLDKTLTDKQALGLDTIRQGGEHLLTLINDLLDLAKIEAGKLELTLEPACLQTFLASVDNIARVRAEQKGLQFRLETVGALPGTLMVDEKRLRQILLNLLGNAVKFTDAGQVTLRVAHCGAQADRVRVRFEVQDTGVGMNATQLERIFQPFEQVGDAQRRHGGTGLGLSISRQLARLMGSEVSVSSVPGGGSTFAFELEAPVSTVAVPPVAPPRNVVACEGARRKVLVVDDVAANRQLLSDLLGTKGFEVTLAADGQQGVEQALAARPDVILMDIVMPVLDGLEAMRRIRREPALQRVRIVAISASVSRQDEDSTYRAGADAFLSKPIEQNLLLERIAELLELRVVYDSTAPLGDEPAAKAASPGALVVPPAAEVETLRQLALGGNMREIRQQADHIEALGVQYKVFADRLRSLARGYQSKAILELVNDAAQPGAAR